MLGLYGLSPLRTTLATLVVVLSLHPHPVMSLTLDRRYNIETDLPNQAETVVATTQFPNTPYLSDDYGQFWRRLAATMGPPGLILGLFSMAFYFRERRRYHERLTRVSQDAVAAGEKERTRIARELHDGICQMLALSKHSLERACESAEACNSRHTQHLRSGLGNLEECIREIRRISHGLKAALPANQPFAEALVKLVREFADRTQVGLHLDGLDTANSEKLSPCVQHALYRTTQEALMNIEKHAKASQIALALKEEGEEGQVTLAILDNGCGIRRAKGCNRVGIGVSNMRERVNEVGGAFTLRSSTHGTQVIARVPTSQHTSENMGLCEASASDLRQVRFLRKGRAGSILTQVSP